ncbi:MAG: radical SAM family heme chaperone HemW [Tannerella sp.]|jgi:oxygen-independent coproporphyrinogen-3 oxidase|nr:radical SAM family heme chaperone HemW [Tannerella sp.]
MAGLYVHIPFCVKRCIYCDFYSNTDLGRKGEYVSALVREMEMRSDAMKNSVIETVYFGGGTPSQLCASDFGRLFDAAYRCFSVAAAPEITLEANPDDLSDTYVESLKQFPFNRISIGIQSFIDDELRRLNRRHTAREALDAVYRCKDAGFDNISVDIMYGLPSQTTECWEYNVDKAVELDVQHISAYCLTYEEGAAIYEMRERGDVQPVDDDLSEVFFRRLVEKLADAGFVHYEISNFAKCSPDYPDGRVSLHNSSYWNGTHYVGLGAAAHSYDGDTRSWNVSSTSDYIRSIIEDDVIPCEIECLNERMKYNDFIITRLRTMRGVSPKELEKEFGEARKHEFLEKIHPFLCSEMLKIQGEYVKVDYKGIFLCDAIIVGLLSV